VTGEVESASFRACIPEAEHAAFVLTTRFGSRTAAGQAVLMLLAVKANYGRVRSNQGRIMKPIQIFLLFPVFWAINSLGVAKPDPAGSFVISLRGAGTSGS